MPRAFGAGEARSWALENLKGQCGCILPTFTSDLKDINEDAIRHDVRREKELGMSGVLIVSECGTTFEELERVTEIVVDEAAGELHTIAHGALATLEDNVRLAQLSEAAGVDGILCSYPLMFYPTSEDEVYEYTKKLADSSNLGLIIFAINLWNFRRLHPSDFNPDLIGRLIDDAPNVMAVKTEIGLPSAAGVAQIFERYGDRVVVTDPLEPNAPIWQRNYGMQWMGTSNYEAMGGELPKYFKLLQEDKYEEAMEIYWRLHPLRLVNGTINWGAVQGTSLVHRLVWKYQGWLNGFNGGPIRSPQMRLDDAQMRQLRAAAIQAGLDVTDEPDSAFFVGRNPR
ncbi:MAG TPA: dihydrodipicolinate synthase family protein [Baekduia sp.]|uniref:dihydrodipicolinate synthase family protein n=1 Tax=Baekduia sp. TaxID=2600305 RepID=UPI002D78849F|nr:dihydrodipicolinate synthase family protein [Baekduia sp.]HET6509023.1 dihydrodipicolinate synthase family protein [Baekduia sp.]